ncbi:alpha,alpha-trehalase nth1 [Batrachochytrium dendrobatidis]
MIMSASDSARRIRLDLDKQVSIKPQIHLEEELFYADKDHKIAHGHGDEEYSYGVIRRVRAMSVMAARPLVPPVHMGIFQEIHQPSPTPVQSIHKRRSSHDASSVKDRRFLIDVEKTKQAILAQEDTDGDCQITIYDTGPKSFIVGTADSGGFHKFEIRGTYALSNLLQELALASEYGRKTIVLNEARINENPVDRMSRLIKYHFWDGLTRRIDADGLEKICADPKNRGQDQRSRIYVPFHDAFALEYYNTIAKERLHLGLDVVQLPEIISPEYVKSLDTSPGILSLSLRKQVDSATGEVVVRGAPFVVPGGRFNEMYGWDSYFEALGLAEDDRIELARGMIENFHYELEHYGKILNANRSYYLTRSQPPFLTDMTIQVYNKLVTKGTWEPKTLHAWMIQSIKAAIKELLGVWMVSPRLDATTGLYRYYTEGVGMPPETESSHFDHIIRPFADRRNLSIEEYTTLYNNLEISEPELDQYFVHDRAVRESGHDTTYRFEKRCANLATVDLASLIYKYQKDIGVLIDTHCKSVIAFRVRKGKDDTNLKKFLKWREAILSHGVTGCIGDNGHWDSSWAKGLAIMGEDLFQESVISTNTIPDTKHEDLLVIDYEETDASPDFFIVKLPARIFTEMASHTQTKITKYLWSPTDKMFFDWDCELHEQSVYETVTCLWTLWAGCATPQQAEVMVPTVLSKFEAVGGLVSGTEESRGTISLDRPNRQWDFPFGWAPHQIMAWAGLKQYGYSIDARRICYRWLYVLTKSFVDFNGVVSEKLDVVNMTHKIDVEYGNVGADFQFVVREGFGWMNASYQVGLTYLNESMRRALGALTPPDQLFRKLGI